VARGTRPGLELEGGATVLALGRVSTPELRLVLVPLVLNEGSPCSRPSEGTSTTLQFRVAVDREGAARWHEARGLASRARDQALCLMPPKLRTRDRTHPLKHELAPVTSAVVLSINGGRWKKLKNTHTHTLKLET